MSKLILLLGNGFTIDLISKLGKSEVINTKNLFCKGDLVEWPDGQGKKGFLSYKNCRNLWNLGARPHMNERDAQEMIEDIISCANTLTRTMLDLSESENIYRSAYYELIAYLKHLFIMYNDLVLDSELMSEKINEWGWYRLINGANNSDLIDEINIITYNYDIFLERVLKLHNIGFNIVGLTDNDEKIKIFKPHGSISFCHQNSGEKSSYSIRKDPDMYEAKLTNFIVRYDKLDENYYIDAMIPPSGDSSRMTFQWAKEIRDEIETMVNHMTSEDKMVISGLSYWHVDRREIDDILVNTPKNVEISMVNPNPPKSLEAVISSIFDNYVLFSDSSSIGGLYE
ncbi:SIR2-like domain-containing protein [Butyrivibrio sp. Su6]|uniref:SIR2 family protein n=1 Tax=Butyrivibrio sp. Su6 TaxID=1520810 RepID=UPI00089F28A4|nr:SIR2 family protein [Butyrivibrio sp. Su6]SEG16475.1 SIR2-like domain-containing protein [Butyrivibrio sp. Su6]